MIRRRPKIRLTQADRQHMRIAGRFNAKLIDFIRPYVREGITTEKIDQLVHDYTLDHGHTPACLGYPGEHSPYPKSCCISINDVICHGIPSAYELKPGDIVNVDLTTIVNGWHGDQSETFIIGEHHQVLDLAREVTQAAFDSLYAGIDAISPGCTVSVIGQAIVELIQKRHPSFGIVEKYVGHGIGARFHQRPNVPHVPTRQSRQDRLYPGMCFTIEPMVNTGTERSQLDPHDGWTVRTLDGGLSAQFEHTILMTEDGPEILTLTQDGPQVGFKF